MTEQNLSDSEFDELVRRELEAAFRADRLRLGDIFRCLDQGMSDSEIQSELGLATAGSLGHVRRSIRAIRDGWNPPGLGPANIAKSDLGRLLREFSFSEPVRTHLRIRYEALEDNVQQIKEQRISHTPDDLKGSDESSSEVAIAGVYVWTINTYLEIEDERGQVWFRIGCSEDIHQRMREHRNTVKLPEPLILARVYSHNTYGSRELESRFHRICGAAVHERARVNNRDREWFRTNIEFLDQYALDIGCRSHVELIEEDL